MIYVIGSGPAGVSCSKALLERGEKITMLDAGNEPEEKITQKLELFRKNPDHTEITSLKGTLDTRGQDSPLKLSYGSDYPYQGTPKITEKNVLCRTSHAQGGLSTVWGAAIMPYLAKDCSTWPLKYSELDTYFKKVLEFMPIAGYKDELEEYFPLHSKPTPYPRCSQTKLLLETMNKNKKKLASQNIFFGHARLAVHFNGTKDKPACIKCANCLYGCPLQIIYSSSFTLKELLKNPNFNYEQGIIVEKISEENDTAIIHAGDSKKNKKLTFRGERVFVACGSALTTRIMMKSLDVKEITLKDSQHFVIPCLTLRRAKGVSNEKLHTLSQAFIELIPSEGKSAHLQIYTYNDLYEQRLKQMFGKMYSPLKPILNLLLERIIAIQGYLHSDDSSEITIKENGNELQQELNPLTETKAKQIIKLLRRNTFKLGFTPIPFMNKLSKSAGGSHIGSSFPMGTKSDLLGRPIGLQRIHLVDSSVLPSIAAQTITLTAMANAYRIGATTNLK
ncbi:GMC family oxidoreductase N-terminal domain-containing protein [Candidatus Woesearchaeota archaeon]|nr:GMC family oxidoreductase N-terminal domain-containing protein [Candidatus Woesearchaeota archaeon]